MYREKIDEGTEHVESVTRTIYEKGNRVSSSNLAARRRMRTPKTARNRWKRTARWNVLFTLSRVQQRVTGWRRVSRPQSNFSREAAKLWLMERRRNLGNWPKNRAAKVTDSVVDGRPRDWCETTCGRKHRSSFLERGFIKFILPRVRIDRALCNRSGVSGTLTSLLATC